jgi:NitT/TauT family transport system permease protein
MKALTHRRVASTLLIIGVFAFWELACLVFNVSDIVLPRPSQVVVEIWNKWPAILPHAIQTLYTTLVGFVWGVLLGVFFFVLWFGAGAVPAILTSITIAMFPVVVNVATGLATTEPELEDVLKALKATKMDILWNVGLPRTAPYFFASLKVAVTLAFVGTVISETVASNKGIGNLMMTASSSFNVPLVFSGLFLLAAMGIALHVVFSLIEQRLTGWANRKSELAAN